MRIMFEAAELCVRGHWDMLALVGVNRRPVQTDFMLKIPRRRLKAYVAARVRDGHHVQYLPTPPNSWHVEFHAIVCPSITEFWKFELGVSRHCNRQGLPLQA